MDISSEQLKKILLITFGTLIALLILINIMRYFNSLPGYQDTVYPTLVPQSQSQHEDIFPTQKPSEVNQQLVDILNHRAILSDQEKQSIASLSAELILHPHRDTDFEITYSPILNLFFIRKRGNTDDNVLIEYLADPTLRKMYRENGFYRLFVISKNSAEYSKYVFERQYNEVRSKLSPDKRP